MASDTDSSGAVIALLFFVALWMFGMSASSSLSSIARSLRVMAKTYEVEEVYIEPAYKSGQYCEETNFPKKTIGN